MNGVILFCDHDEEGKIIDSLTGERVIPQRQYMCFFYLVGTTTEQVLANIPNYRVVNGELTLV